ncbi:polysaccharide pyruvyl transferase family protein [uncultured Fibrobacter sp.]|uniref:polysaccharide pyruvyl transferase family protein n=1 Tax=uncultured Fibrobacter sp. TaxID=261512 RepID=UPI00263449BE|nr:polysaccharide pyruvyl transferase family protein [uncultured Fibrobacter sp.]
MKSVGMITIYRKNYGAFLQAYALQRTLIKLGYSPEIIRYDYYRDHSILGVPLTSKISLKQTLKSILVEILRYFPHKKRIALFNESVKSNIIESKEYYKTYEKLESNPPQYDVFLTGGDQVFNAMLSPQALPARVLSFVKKGKKASYSASAGGADFEQTSRDFIVSNLKTFDKVSVREESLAETLHSKYKINSSSNIDPVFLLDKVEWGNFSKELKILKGKYLFFYSVLSQPELVTLAARISKEYDIPVFAADGCVRFKNQISFSGVLSPEQWVYAVNNAEIVVTNSFHGTAFAINLKKKTYIMMPPKRGERVRNLLFNCGLMIDHDGEIKSSDCCNLYETSERYIESEKRRSFEFLKSIV